MQLVVAFALLGQSSSAATGTSLEDLAFSRAVEESVAAAPPTPYRLAIERLGASSYAERRWASAELTEALRANPADRRWLFWGRKHPDLEIRLRCNAILRRLNPCATCEGSGNSKNWEPWPCWDCQGWGTAWPYSIWD